MTELYYGSKKMEWTPTRIRSLVPNGPLKDDEPVDSDILWLMDNGYAVFVRLEPGDATMYGLVLSGNRDRISALRVGGDRNASAIAFDRSHSLDFTDFAPLSPNNTWSQEFFAWWLNNLVA